MSPSPEALSERQSVMRAIVLKLLSVALFTAMGGLIKSLGTRIPVGEVVFFRSAVAFIPIAIMVAGHGGIAALRTTRLGSHARRALPGLGGMVGGFAAITMLPLADAVAINFMVPILTTLLAILLLRETVDRWRGSAIGLGFIGMVLIVQPGAASMSIGVLAGLAGTISTAFAMIAIRQMPAEEPSFRVVFYFTLTCALAGAASLLFDAVMPTPLELAALVGAGLLGGVAQILMTASYRLAPASVVVPFDYTALVFALAAGFLIWNEVPTAAMLAGAGIVIISGLIILAQERRTGRATPIADVPGT